MYAYGRNNPLKYTDPTGTNYTVCDTQGHCHDWTDQQWNDWRQSQGNSIIYRPAGDFLNHETEKKICSAQYYDEKPLAALKEAGIRAAPDTGTAAITIGLFATSYISTYAAPAIPGGLAAMGEVGAVGGNVVRVVFRGQQLPHAMRVEPGHNTPAGTAAEVQAAVNAAVKSGSYTVGSGGVVKGTAYIQGVAHEFAGFMRTA